MENFIITIIHPGTFEFSYNRQYCPDENMIQIAERAFEEWNSGSGNECKEFKDNHVRSLSVGDFVKINNHIFKCEPSGWNEVTTEYLSNFIDKVKNHSDFKKLPWKALMDILWKEKSLNK